MCRTAVPRRAAIPGGRADKSLERLGRVGVGVEAPGAAPSRCKNARGLSWSWCVLGKLWSDNGGLAWPPGPSPVVPCFHLQCPRSRSGCGVKKG